MDSLKSSYAIVHSEINSNSYNLNRRLFSTYNKISNLIYGHDLKVVNIDLGSGDKMFSKLCYDYDRISYSYDYPDFDIEIDKLNHMDESIDFITMNAVIEHIYNPSNILNECYRVLKKDGIIIIRTPNFQLDYKNFYNDPTHVKPYTPKSLTKILELHNFKVDFCESGLIEKSPIWWKLPNKIKWYISSKILGGTKSILVVGRKV